MSVATKVKDQVVVRESIVNDAPRFVADFPVGAVVHQGDVIIVSIGKLPPSAKARKNCQIADGDTQGSRHIVERGDVFDCDADEVVSLIKAACPKATVEARYVGPVFRSPANPTEHDLTHPEHGHYGFEAGAVCAVVVQRSLDAEQREQRVAD